MVAEENGRGRRASRVEGGEAEIGEEKEGGKKWRERRVITKMKK